MSEPVIHNHPDPESPQGRMQNALFRVLKSLVFRGEPDSPLNELPISQLRALHAIAAHEGERMQQLCPLLETKLPALSQVVERLVRRGLIDRRADPSDRRAVQLYLTESAHQIMAKSNAIRQARMDQTVSYLRAEEIQLAIEGLSALADAAERLMEEEKAASVDNPDPLVELISRRRTGRQAAEQEA